MAQPRYARILRNVGRSREVLRCVAASPDWPRTTLAYLGLRGAKYPCDLRMRSGDVLALEGFHDLATAWVIYCRREYMVLPSDRVIVDAGANIGVFTLYAARQARDAKIVAIEPFPPTRDRLDQTILRNALAGRVTVRGWALARAVSERQMDLAQGPSQSRGMLPTGSQVGLTVEAVSLDALFEREGLDRVDLLKMDIEGGEHEVLAGASENALARVDRLALEYHPGGSKDVLFARLARAGFVLTVDRPAAPDSGVAEFRRRPERAVN